jgi:hypothetical protein
MKKIFAILALAVSSTAFAGSSATVEYRNANNIGSADQNVFVLGVKHDFNNTFAGDVAFVNTQTDGTNALGTRLEAGVTAAADFGIVKGYVRTALGQRYSNTTNYTYYSVEPGVMKTFGAFTAKVGYRFRDATDTNVNTSEHTGTTRIGVSYALTKNDSIGVRYDRVHGDANSKGTSVFYTRGF